jgi:hypothetical protein
MVLSVKQGLGKLPREKRGREKRKDRPWQKSEKAEILQCAAL